MRKLVKCPFCGFVFKTFGLNQDYFNNKGKTQCSSEYGCGKRFDVRGNKVGEIDKHLEFLRRYANKYKIIFRVSRTTISVEMLSKLKGSQKFGSVNNE